MANQEGNIGNPKNDNRELIEKEFFENKRERRFKIIERSFWMTLSFISILRITYIIIFNPLDIFIDHFSDIIFAIILILLPILFNLIFGLLPFQFLRKSVKNNKDYSNIQIHGNGNIVQIKPTENDDNLKSLTSEQLLIKLTHEAKVLSEKILTRAGAYLLVGILIAISGVVYFASRSIVIQGSNHLDWTSLLLIFLPRFGALFFVEFIAFFFLKQYRIMMDEFRYYESIKRQRESNLLLLKIASEDSKQYEVIKNDLELFNNPDKIKKDETTSIIESRKYTNEELNIFNNIINKISGN